MRCLALLLALLLAPAAAAQTQVQFARLFKQEYPETRDVHSHAVGDFTGDRRLDVIAIYWDGTKSAFLTGDGGGGFTAKPFSLPKDNYNSAVAADFDGDGDLDFACGCGPHDGQRNRLFLNHGNGTFAESPMPADRRETHALAAGDVDGDGDLDLVAGNRRDTLAVDAQNTLYLNDGKGRFTDVTVSHMPKDADDTAAIALGDVDGDKDLDLVIGNGATTKGANKLYLNDGKGKFQDATTGRLPSFVAPTLAVALLDVDQDRDLDLVAGNGSSSPGASQDRLYLNDGTGRFTHSKNGVPQEDVQTIAMAAGDLDGDGDVDLFAGSFGPDRVLLNDGKGVFTTHEEWVPRHDGFSVQATLADVGADGDLDVFLSNNGAWEQLFLNDRKRRFLDTRALSLRVTFGAFATQSVAVADLDGNGVPDMVFGRPDLYLGTGVGHWVRRTSTHLPATAGGARPTIADVNGDGSLDLLFAVFGKRNTLFLGDGQGRFRDATAGIPARNDRSKAIAAADLSGDGKLDLFVGNNGQSRLLFGRGDGTFFDVTAANVPTETDPTSDVEAVDVDGDKDLDLVLANGSPGLFATQNRLWLNDGKGRFKDVTATHLPAFQDHTSGVAAGDIDGDGDTDLAFANGQRSGLGVDPGRLYLNRGDGRFVDGAAGIPGNALSGRNVVMGDLDSDGKVDLATDGIGIPFGLVSLLLAVDGKGRFRAAGDRVSEYLPYGQEGIAATDADGDGDLDLVVCERLLFNRYRQVFSPTLARMGRSYQLAFWLDPGLGGGAAVPLLAAAALPAPLPTAWGPLRVDLTSTLVLPPVPLSGYAEASLPIPRLAALYGRTLYTQAFLLGAASARLTNMVGDRVVD